MDENGFEKKIYMTNSFPREVMEEIFAGCPSVTVEKKMFLYQQGEKCPYVYWLYEGAVEVYAANEKGLKQVIAYHLPDSIVADIQSLSEETTFLNCAALQKSKFKKMDIDKFVDKLVDMGLIRDYLKLLVMKTQVNVVQLTSVTLDDCETRIRKYYDNKLTHTQLSELVGCSRVHVTRILNKQLHDEARPKNTDNA